MTHVKRSCPSVPPKDEKSRSSSFTWSTSAARLIPLRRLKNAIAIAVSTFGRLGLAPHRLGDADVEPIPGAILAAGARHPLLDRADLHLGRLDDHLRRRRGDVLGAGRRPRDRPLAGQVGAHRRVARGALEREHRHLRAPPWPRPAARALASPRGTQVASVEPRRDPLIAGRGGATRPLARPLPVPRGARPRRGDRRAAGVGGHAPRPAGGRRAAGGAAGRRPGLRGLARRPALALH